MNNEYHADEHGEEIEIEALGIEVNTQPIELYKVMKIANLVSGGGEAKHAISEGYVAVNGELETRKRRKMYDGDFFEFNQEYYVVVFEEQALASDTTDSPTREEALEPAPAISHQTNEDKALPSEAPNEVNNTSNRKRKSLDFL